MKPRNGDTVYRIAGAGPAGLAAAITLARAGKPVVVHEARSEVGHRFQRDLQGLENWTTRGDVLDEWRALGLSTDFEAEPFRHGHAFDAWGKRYDINSIEPMFYMIERGPRPGSLDSALLNQARELGVEIRFNSRLERLNGPGVLAVGPKAADAIAVGYHFDTERENGFWVIVDDDLAPQGYAYLLIMNGRGTVKTCMFSRFNEQKQCLQRTMAAFERLVGLEMHNPRFHGGAGNFRIPEVSVQGCHPVVGEQAGFQDTLWGFGIRLAVRSGVMAAQSLLDGEDYDSRWKHELEPMMQASVVNRQVFARLGNRGYRFFLQVATRRRDVRAFLHRYYRMGLIKRGLWPWARATYRSNRRDLAWHAMGCDCVWCQNYEPQTNIDRA